MITVQTYIPKPHATRPGYVGFKQMNEYFLAIENDENREEVKRTFERDDNFLGCILITCGEQVVMDDELIERLPLYWVIWVDLIGDYVTNLPDDTREVSRDQYFSLKKTDDRHMFINYYDYYVSIVPEEEFLKTLLLDARYFFDMYHKYSMDRAYISISKKVDTLLSVVTEQIQMNGRGED